MGDAIPKIIGVLLAFALLVLAPLTISRMTDDMAAKRLILNEVSQFIDRVTDKGSVTKDDMDDLYIALNTHGAAFDAEVVRYVRTAVPSGAGAAESVYIAADDTFGSVTVVLRAGDVVQVRVTELTRTTAQKLLYKLMRVYEKNFDFTLAGVVR
jgi:ABC-type amino acid transport system permease subunit